jgi:hypothetical protein
LAGDGGGAGEGIGVALTFACGEPDQKRRQRRGGASHLVSRDPRQFENALTVDIVWI